MDSGEFEYRGTICKKVASNGMCRGCLFEKVDCTSLDIPSCADSDFPFGKSGGYIFVEKQQ